MKKALLSICLCLISHLLISQNLNENLLHKRDSLKKELNASRDESKTADILCQIALTHMFINMDSAIYYGQKFISVAEKSDFKNRLLNALAIVGEAHFYKGELSKALELSLRAVRIMEDNPGHTSTSSLPDSLILNMGPAYWVLSEIYHQIGDDEKAHEYADKVINTDPTKLGIGYGHYLKGRIFEKNNQLDSAMSHINLSLEIFEEASRETNYLSDKYDANPDSYNLLAKVYLKQGKPDMALVELKNILAINILRGETLNIANTYNDLAHFFSIQNRPDSSIYYARKALVEAEKINFVKGKLDSYMLLAQKYESIDPVNALYYYKLATSTQNSLYGAGNIQVLKDMIAQKEKEKEALELAETNYENMLKQYLLMGSLLVVLLIAFIFLRNSKKSKAANLVLENTLNNLKSTQTQLFHSEKMASLGELTAGIAHEIQNPLNFVNNFSEVNKELMEELKEELENGNMKEVNSIAQDIIDNEEKVMHHGKRAEGIVKGMLQHSRGSEGKKEPTDLNILADEFLRLAYHGLRAKDKSFNAEFKTEFDESLPNINVVPQDIGRVLLNLINNAFYAVSEASHPMNGKEASETAVSNYKPIVTVSTKLMSPSGGPPGQVIRTGGKGEVIISIKDNGSGIPEQVRDKIFQPFFTTKPTGQGTGLGLSLSYDIVTKGHGGELKVETKIGEGSEFIINLPLS